jgi:N-acetyltransferase
VIRHFSLRRDGTVRDTVMYSILATEWPDVRRYLELRLLRHAQGSSAGAVQEAR